MASKQANEGPIGRYSNGVGGGPERDAQISQLVRGSLICEDHLRQNRELLISENQKAQGKDSRNSGNVRSY